MSSSVPTADRHEPSAIVIEGHGGSMSRDARKLACGFQVPNESRVAKRHCQPRAISAEGNRLRATGTAVPGLDHTLCPEIPQFGKAVFASGGEQFAAGTKRQRAHGARMGGEHAAVRHPLRVPDLGQAIRTAGPHQRAVGTEGHGHDSRRVTFESGSEPHVGQVHKQRSFVSQAGHEPPPIAGDGQRPDGIFRGQGCFLPGFQIVEDDAVAAAHRQATAVGREGQGVGPALGFLSLSGQRGEIPEPGVVSAAANQPPTPGVEAYAVDAVLMSVQASDLPSVAGIPQPDRVIPAVRPVTAARCDHGAIGTVSEGEDTIVMLFEAGDLAPVGRVPDAASAIIRAGSHESSVGAERYA